MKRPVDAEAFAGELALHGVKLPLTVGRSVEAGVVFDADKKAVAVVDVDRQRSNRTALAIARLIAEAVNARAGVQPVKRDVGIDPKTKVSEGTR